MTTASRKLGNERLLMLAAAVEHDPAYDQSDFGRCETPGCLLGHAPAVFPEEWRWSCGTPIPISALTPSVNGTYFGALKFFALSDHEYDDVFSAPGCDDAQRDGSLAAAYVRDFVARRGDGEDDPKPSVLDQAMNELLSDDSLG